MTTPPGIHDMQHQLRKAVAAQQNLSLAEDEPVPLHPDLTLLDIGLTYTSRRKSSRKQRFIGSVIPVRFMSHAYMTHDMNM
jgi:hypothetical protein